LESKWLIYCTIHWDNKTLTQICSKKKALFCNLKIIDCICTLSNWNKKRIKIKKTLLSLLAVATFALANAQTNLPADAVLPPNGEAGKCYVKCITPDVWSNQTVQVLVRPAYTKLKVIPATYETVTESYI